MTKEQNADLNKQQKNHTEEAKELFGKNISNVYYPKENAVYVGEVQNTQGTVFQYVGPRTVIAHDKEKIDFKGAVAGLKGSKEETSKLELQIHYKNGKGYAATYDAQKEHLAIAVKSLTRSAEELDMPGMKESLDRLHQRSKDRIDEVRNQRLRGYSTTKERQSEVAVENKQLPKEKKKDSAISR